MKRSHRAFTLDVDLTNPGQFYACCGLLELADRLWPGTEAWFDVAKHRFCMDAPTIGLREAPRALVEALADAEIKNTMSVDEIARRAELRSMSRKERKAQGLEDEKGALDKAWRESPILIPKPFCLRVDWFLDDRAGGSIFKTWAGQQSVIDIARRMHASIPARALAPSSARRWFFEHSERGGVSFNFDSIVGGQGSDLDVGFSLDPLGISTAARPLIEFLSFVGLQRCRPATGGEPRRYRYYTWTEPCGPELAAALAPGCLRPVEEAHCFEFRLLYRTKYLKSFLPATPIGASP